MKYYTCRKRISSTEMCLKPTVDDTQCIDHVHETALDENFKTRWPIWPTGD